MTRFALLHSPVLGPYSWRAVAEALTGDGVRAQVLALPRLSELAGDYYDALADAAAAQIATSVEPTILVAHSGAGALVPSVVQRRPELAGVIFVDSILPHPGRSWFDTAPADLRHHLRSGAVQGRLPAWHEWWPPGALERLVPDAPSRDALIGELEPIAVGWLEAVATPGEAPDRSAYLKLSDAYEDEARAANRLGWPLVRLPMNHLAPVAQPRAVASALMGLAERLTG